MTNDYDISIGDAIKTMKIIKNELSSKNKKTYTNQSLDMAIEALIEKLGNEGSELQKLEEKYKDCITSEQQRTTSLHSIARSLAIIADKMPDDSDSYIVKDS